MPLMRNLGAFFGHIAKAVKTDVNRDKKPGDEAERREVKRTVEEEDRGDVVLRRTTVEEIEFKKDSEKRGARSEPPDADD